MSEQTPVTVRVPTLLANSLSNLSKTSGVSIAELVKFALGRQVAFSLGRFHTEKRWPGAWRAVMEDAGAVMPERDPDPLQVFVNLFPRYYPDNECTKMAVVVPEELWNLVGRIAQTSDVSCDDLFSAAVDRMLLFAQQLPLRMVFDEKLREALQRDLESTVNGIKRDGIG